MTTTRHLSLSYDDSAWVIRDDSVDPEVRDNRLHVEMTGLTELDAQAAKAWAATVLGVDASWVRVGGSDTFEADGAGA